MDTKQFLALATAVSLIGGGGSIAMYYQNLIREHTRDRDRQESVRTTRQKYWYGLFYDNAYKSFSHKKNYAIRRECQQRQLNLISLMQKDGYCYSDIGCIVKSQTDLAREVWEIIEECESIE